MLPKPSEFEVYVNRLAAPNIIRRLGADLMTDPDRANPAVDYSPLVPPDYLLSAGDEIVVSIWGSVDAELRLTVDRSGRITVPRGGSILVSGVRYADLPALITQRLAQVFKNFQVSVSLGQLRGVRVYVTGFVDRPGAYTVNALSSISAALVRAGGPSVAGSFRDIQLRRGGKVVSTLDFYDLLLNGERGNDRLVQAEDVIHIGPVGLQVAVIGSVNRPAIFELKPDETIVDVQRMVGGFSAVADRTPLRAGTRRSARHRARGAGGDGQRSGHEVAERRRAARLQRRHDSHRGRTAEQARAGRRRGAASGRVRAAARHHGGRRAERGRRHDAGRVRLRHRFQP